MLKVDLHVHTIKSRCGYSTFKEMVDEAKKRKIKILGITDHGPGDLNTEIPIFLMAYRVPKMINGIHILYGGEFNIINEKGELDVDDDILKNLGVVIAGLHKLYDSKVNGSKVNYSKDVKRNTKAVVNAIKNPYVQIISHPTFFGEFELDIEEVAYAACKYKKLLELNVSHFRHQNKIKEESIPAIKKMIKIIQENNHKLIINTDSHYWFELGDDTPLMKMQKELGFRNKDIINNDINEVKRFFKIK